MSLRGRVLGITLIIILAIAIVGTLGTLGYIIVTPKVGETFTEFYILGPEGKATNYPRELKLGESGRVIMGIVNHEDREVTYRVEVSIAGSMNIQIGPVVLAAERKSVSELSLVPEVAGENQKVEFLLYRDGGTEPYLEPLFLWINVSE